MMQAPDAVELARELAAPARRLGTLTLGAVVLVLVVLALCVWPLLPALTSAPGKAPVPVPEETLAKSVEEFDRQLASAAERVNARAPFGVVKVAPRAEPAAAVAARYAGPQLVGMAAGEAWFAEGRRIKVGETDAGVTVLGLDPPWGAKVRWGGGEFTVSLFDRAPISLSQPLSVWQGAPPPPPPAPRPAAAVVAPQAAPGGPPGTGSGPPGPPPIPPQGLPPSPPANGDGQPVPVPPPPTDEPGEPAPQPQPEPEAPPVRPNP